MDCAIALGIAGYATAELEDLFSEVQEANEVSEDLAIAVTIANRWHYDSSPEKLLRDETDLEYSFSFSLPPIFEPSQNAESAKDLSLDQILRLLALYWGDSETYTNRWISYVSNNPTNANSAAVVEDSQLMSRDSGLRSKFPLADFEVIEDQNGAVALAKLTDTGGLLLPCNEIVWHMRRFLDLFFLRDGSEPKVFFNHYRAYEFESDDISPYDLSVPIFQQLDIFLGPAEDQCPLDVGNSIEFLSQVRIFIDD
jgi:hypothetical protein